MLRQFCLYAVRQGVFRVWWRLIELDQAHRGYPSQSTICIMDQKAHRDSIDCNCEGAGECARATGRSLFLEVSSPIFSSSFKPGNGNTRWLSWGEEELCAFVLDSPHWRKKSEQNNRKQKEECGLFAHWAFNSQRSSLGIVWPTALSSLEGKPRDTDCFGCHA